MNTPEPGFDHWQARDEDDIRLDALDHHAGWCSCRAHGWLEDRDEELSLALTALEESIRTPNPKGSVTITAALAHFLADRIRET